jgi:acetyl-CoA carboxylase biotin carboxyl carrier protein
MTIDEIKELIQVFNESGVAEMEVHRGGNSLRLKHSTHSHEVVIPAAAPVVASSPSYAAPSATAGAAPAHSPGLSASATPNTVDDSHELVKSPIVGTYYECPAPGSPPFVRVGDHVESGQVLCIIESMKLMNEIESEVAGTIVAKLVENGRPVEYGEALFAIRPR